MLQDAYLSILSLIISCYWIIVLPVKLLQYDQSCSWIENAFSELCLLLVYILFYRLPYLLYVLLASYKIGTPVSFFQIYASYVAFGFLLLGCVMLAQKKYCRREVEVAANDCENHRKAPPPPPHPTDEGNEDVDCSIDNGNRTKSFSMFFISSPSLLSSSPSSPSLTQLLSESLELALLDVILIFWILSSTLSILCESTFFGLINNYPNLFNIIHLGLLLKKKLLPNVDITSLHLWIAYACLVLGLSTIAIYFFNCSLRIFRLEFYTNSWIIFLIILQLILSTKVRHSLFLKNSSYFLKFVLLYIFICFFQGLYIYKKHVIVFILQE